MNALLKECVADVENPCCYCKPLERSSAQGHRRAGQAIWPQCSSKKISASSRPWSMRDLWTRQRGLSWRVGWRRLKLFFCACSRALSSQPMRASARKSWKDKQELPRDDAKNSADKVDDVVRYKLQPSKQRKATFWPLPRKLSGFLLRVSYNARGPLRRFFSFRAKELCRPMFSQLVTVKLGGFKAEMSSLIESMPEPVEKMLANSRANTLSCGGQYARWTCGLFND